MHQARQMLATTLAESGPGAALQAMRWASAWSAQAVAGAVARTGDGSLTAIEAVALLDDALAQVSDLLGAVPELVAAARPGPDVESYLRERRKDLDQAAGELRTTRATLAELRDNETRLRDRLAELALLREQVNELRRLEQLVAALTELSEVDQVISDRLAALRTEFGDIEADITTKGADLTRLTRDRRALLADQAQVVLAELETAQAALASVEADAKRDREELAASTRRHADLLAERDQRLAELTAHASADRAVAEALSALPGPTGDASALQRVRSVTDDVERRLAELDAVLKQALDSRDESHRRGSVELPWSG